MVTFAQGRICDQWEVALPDFRVEFHQVRPNWERGRLEDMASRVQPGMVIYDVGAEHGDFTALYRQWVGTNTVVPIEPASAYWPCIRGTFEANGYEPPPLSFYGFAGKGGPRHFKEGISRNSWPAAANDGEVVADPGFRHLAHHHHLHPVVSVDTLAQTYPPDILSIDVEGAEWDVLAGARRTLRSRNVLIYVSVHEPTMLDWYNKTLADLHSLMATVGYTGTLLPAHGEIETFWRYEHTR